MHGTVAKCWATKTLIVPTGLDDRARLPDSAARAQAGSTADQPDRIDRVEGRADGRRARRRTEAVPTTRASRHDDLLRHDGPVYRDGRRALEAHLTRTPILRAVAA